MQELSGVSEAARELAMSRFRLIQPHLEKNRPLQLVAADGKVPFRTAQRWVSQYRKFGLTALVRKSRGDRGGRRVVSPKIKAAIVTRPGKSPFTGQVYLPTGSAICGSHGGGPATLRNGLRPRS
jgi:putative transposase